VPISAIENLTGQLAARARDEFRVLAAATRVKGTNEKAGRAQVRLTHLVAKHFILSVQRAHRGEANFVRQQGGLMNAALVKQSMRLFAEEVMPHFR
jgi:hypothetical protein